MLMSWMPFKSSYLLQLIMINLVGGLHDLMASLNGEESKKGFYISTLIKDFNDILSTLTQQCTALG